MKRFVLFPLQRLIIAYIEQIYPDHVKTICAYNKSSLSLSMINEARSELHNSVISYYYFGKEK